MRAALGGSFALSFVRASQLRPNYPVFALLLCAELDTCLSTNLSPNLTQKTWCGRDRRAGSTAVPAGTPQEGQTARPDLPPASMAQANPGGGNKGLGRHL